MITERDGDSISKDPFGESDSEDEESSEYEYGDEEGEEETFSNTESSGS